MDIMRGYYITSFIVVKTNDEVELIRCAYGKMQPIPRNERAMAADSNALQN